MVNVYPDVTHQTIRGFGGAFTESAAHNYAGMSKEKRQELIKAYFGRGRSAVQSRKNPHE